MTKNYQIKKAMWDEIKVKFGELEGDIEDTNWSRLLNFSNDMDNLLKREKGALMSKHDWSYSELERAELEIIEVLKGRFAKRRKIWKIPILGIGSLKIDENKKEIIRQLLEEYECILRKSIEESTEEFLKEKQRLKEFNHS